MVAFKTWPKVKGIAVFKSWLQDWPNGHLRPRFKCGHMSWSQVAQAQGRLWTRTNGGLGMAMGRGGTGSKDGVFVLAPHDFVLPHPRLTPHDGENFPTPSLPLGAPRNPTLSRKTLLFVNLPYNQYNFFNETYFINKNIFEITTKFIPSNQINFFKKKLNNISKYLTRQSQKKIKISYYNT